MVSGGALFSAVRMASSVSIIFRAQHTYYFDVLPHLAYERTKHLNVIYTNFMLMVFIHTFDFHIDCAPNPLAFSLFMIFMMLWTWMENNGPLANNKQPTWRTKRKNANFSTGNARKWDVSNVVAAAHWWIHSGRDSSRWLGSFFNFARFNHTHWTMTMMGWRRTVHGWMRLRIAHTCTQLPRR